MSMLDAFFNKSFKASKCKTLLKLSIPRIKLLRNRREIQIRQMRHDIAKLLETGQEATARIRVEHIIREENMMAAQEVLELFCELISVRLPIIETQRECPLDLKEAISSVCFAAPRCADLPELLQVQMMFASKYGKEFVAAASELMPDCGVNRQLIELLSVRAPPAEKKLKLLKEIAEEHEIDWDPAASETEFLKPHEDLLVSENSTASETELLKPHEDLLVSEHSTTLLMLPLPTSCISLICQNGPTQFVSGSKVPIPKEKHDETLYSSPVQASNEKLDSDSDSDLLDFPEVPQMPLRPSATVASAPEIVHPAPLAFHPGTNHESSQHLEPDNIPSEKPSADHDQVMPERSVANEGGTAAVQAMGNKQFLPFISSPSLSSASFSAGRHSPPPSLPRAKSDVNIDLQDVLAAAQAAADSAERAAAAARSAASLAQIRIAEMTRKRDERVPENICENPFSAASPNQSASPEKKPYVSHQSSMESSGGDDIRDISDFQEPVKAAFDSSPTDDHVYEHDHQPQRLPSMDDDSYFSHPNLFTSQDSNAASGTQSFPDNYKPDHVFDHEQSRHQPERLPSMDDDYSYPNLFTSHSSIHGPGAHSFSENSRTTHDL